MTIDCGQNRIEKLYYVGIMPGQETLEAGEIHDEAHEKIYAQYNDFCGDLNGKNIPKDLQKCISGLD